MKGFFNRGPGEDPRDEERKQADQEKEEIVREVLDFLRRQRFGQEDEPFRGFGSPPGKF